MVGRQRRGSLMVEVKERVAVRAGSAGCGSDLANVW